MALQTVTSSLVDVYRGLVASDNVSYILTDRLRIHRTNAAYDRFAAANGGSAIARSWSQGASLLDAISEALRPFYADGFARARAQQRVWEHDYECSSPTHYRAFRMLAYPVGEWFVVTHALRVEHPHTRDAHAPDSRYESSGVIAMCSHCRRVRAATLPERWDWVPEYLASPRLDISHGLCPGCYHYHYGDLIEPDESAWVSPAI